MSKFDGHTPKPWTANHSLVLSGKGTICACHDSGEGNYIENAILIAAAPDLLAELKACREFLASITEVPSSGDIGIRLAAIGKLIGEG